MKFKKEPEVTKSVESSILTQTNNNAVNIMAGMKGAPRPIKRKLPATNTEKMIMLTPAPNFKDYSFNMNKNEGICDLFDLYKQDLWDQLAEPEHFWSKILLSLARSSKVYNLSESGSQHLYNYSSFIFCFFLILIFIFLSC